MTEIEFRSDTASPRPGEVAVTVDRLDDIIRLTCRGFVTPLQVEESFVALRRLFDEREGQGRQVKVLVDNRRMSIQSADTADRIAAGVRKHHRDDHHVAIVLSSALAVMQMRRITLEQGPAFFDEEIRAVEWLRAASSVL